MDHSIVGGSRATDFWTTADPGTGLLDVFAHGHDSAPKEVNSSAGVGFWYVPNRSGYLTVSAAPSLRDHMWTGASWNDVAAAGGWISIGIASYLRNPFTFVRWDTVNRSQLWWNVDNRFDWTDKKADLAAFELSASTIADVEHYYACWVWIRAYVYTENGGSYAGSGVTATVGGFRYALL